jgi:hypothetical protein
MSPPTYYFVNKTREEFCSFNDTLPILQELMAAIKMYDWTVEDEIKVECELSNQTFLVEYLTNDKGYMWLDFTGGG